MNAASMGKIEYEISDKGNFSFPLTSLRDDLILKIQDNEGNEISRAGIHIRLILEKGVWEDMFPIGGGHLHLKLQVILSDEARDRIRIMRQSALKKKHDELLRSSRRDAESDSSAITGNAALPFHTSNEVSDQYKETSSTKPVSQQQEPNINQLQHKGKEPANHSPSEKHPQRVTGSKEMVIFLGSKKNNVLPNNPIKHNQEDDDLEFYEKKRPPRRTPSNVSKMISAFESGLAQDMRPHIKPPPTQYQASTMEMKDSSETQQLEQDKSWNILNKQIDSNARNTEKSNKIAYNRDQKEEKNNKDLMRTSTFEKVTVSGKMPLDYSVAQLDNKYSSFESSGAWTFPEEFRKICLTTSGKSVMGLVESQDTMSSRHQRSLEFTKIENIEKNVAYVGTGTEGSKYEKIQETEESKTNTSDDNGDENSEGPFNQVIKVAIIIGFGLLVLLTRQRKKRLA